MNPADTRTESMAPEETDYLALVIEWDDDVATLVRDPVSVRPTAARTIATVVGAIAAIALATWGMRHLRAAA